MVLVLAGLAGGFVPGGWAEDTPATDGYAKAVELLQEGIVFEAINELERYTRAYPDHEDARMLLARSLRRVRRDARAAEELSHVIRLNPGNMEAQRLLTRLRVEIGQRLDRSDRDAVLRYARLCAIPESYDRSADYYRLALELGDDVAVHLEFARMLAWAGRYAESALHYESFLKSNPVNIEVLLELGRVCNSSGLFTQAVDVFERCLAEQPEHVPASLDLARALIWSGREAEAEERLRAMERKQVGGEVPLLLLASIARIRNRVLDEYTLLQQVLARVPTHAEALARVAALEKGSLLDEARLLRHLETAPEDVEARRKLADLYIAASRHGDALYQLNMIREAVPDDLAVMKRLRAVRAEEMRRVMAQVDAFRSMRAAERQREIARIERWLGQNTNDMKSRLRLAELYADGGNYAEAVVHLEWLQAAAPGNAHIQQTLYRTQLLLAERLQQPDEANQTEPSTTGTP
jgi:tetratricopeptide (TPR) repeat protein